MRVYLFIIVTVFYLSLLSCKDDSSEPNEYAAKIIAQLNPSDTFLYYFPKNKNARLDSFIRHSKMNEERLLKLQSLEKGFDSVQIRISYGCALGSGYLVILKHSNNKWQAEVGKLIYQVDSETNNINSISRQVEFISPKSGWNNFINQLVDLKVLSLPDQSEIPGFEEESVNDGCGAAIEIATKKVYRFYGYENPGLYKYWQSKNIILILKLINKEFKIKDKWLWPHETEKDDKKKSIKAPEIRDSILTDIK